MQHNAYYNDSLQFDSSNDPQSKALRIALRLMAIYEAYLTSNPDGDITQEQFGNLFINLYNTSGDLDKVFATLAVLAEPELPTTAFEPTDSSPISQAAIDAVAPLDVKLMLCQKQIIADHEGLCLDDWFQADQVLGLVAINYQLSIGAIVLPNGSSLILDTQIYEN